METLIVHACDMSTLDFCNATLMGITATVLGRLQSILNASTHISPHWRRKLPRGTTRAVPLSKVGWLKYRLKPPHFLATNK